MTLPRAQVVWIGTPPLSEVETAFAARQLVLAAELDTRRAIVLAQHVARAVIVHTRTAGLDEILLELVGPARDAGALVVLVADHREKDHLAEIIRAQGIVAKRFASGRPALYVLDEPDAASRLADECWRYDAGPSLDAAPALGPGGVAEGLDASHRCLIERALHGMSRAELFALGEGLTDARVWRVEGYDLQDRKLAPLVAKLDTVDRIEQEIVNTQTFVAPFVSPRGYAPLVPERCIRGANHAVLVGSFLAGARPLDAHLATCDKPGPTITALFDGPLEPWRQNARVEQIHLASAFRDWGVIQRTRSNLDEAHRRAVALGMSVLEPAQALTILDGLPSVKVRIRITHGDLQARNIFVIDGPHVLLIDFYSTHHEATMSRDPATLDVTLAFDPKAPLDDAALTTLYRSPVLHAATEVFRDPWRSAIAQVRAQCARDRVTDWEYDVAITCYLLRMARLGVQYETLDDARIALAYRLASDLASSLHGRQPPASIL